MVDNLQDVTMVMIITGYLLMFAKLMLQTTIVAEPMEKMPVPTGQHSKTMDKYLVIVII